MPRARNPKTTAAILDAAFALFTEKGYNGTSYADISEASGISRPLVQKYFPKKEGLAIKNLERIRHLSAVCAADLSLKAVTTLEKEFAIAQIYTAALMCTEGGRVFFKDVLRDRELTHATIQNDTLWTVNFLRPEDGDSLYDNRILENSTAALGALYETMYYCLRTGRNMDISARLIPCLENMAGILGVDEASRNAVYRDFTIPRDELEALGRRVFAQALETPWSDEFDQ